MNLTCDFFMKSQLVEENRICSNGLISTSPGSLCYFSSRLFTLINNQCVEASLIDTGHKEGMSTTISELL